MDRPFLLLIAVIAVVLAIAFIASWIHRDRPRRAATGGDGGDWFDFGGDGGSSDCGGSDGGGCGGGD